MVVLFIVLTLVAFLITVAEPDKTRAALMSALTTAFATLAFLAWYLP